MTKPSKATEVPEKETSVSPGNSVDWWDSKHGGPTASPRNLSEMQSLNPGRVSALDLQVLCSPQERLTPGLEHTSALIHDHTRERGIYTPCICLSLVKGCSSRRCKFPGTSSSHVVVADSAGRGEPMAEAGPGATCRKVKTPGGVWVGPWGSGHPSGPGQAQTQNIFSPAPVGTKSLRKSAGEEEC